MKTLGLYNHGDRLEEVDGEGRLPHLQKLTSFGAKVKKKVKP